MSLLVNDDRLTTRVGAAVLGITAAAIVFVVTVYGRMEAEGVRVRVYFAQVTAVPEGAPVQIAGEIIGSLTSISLVRSDDCPPGHPLHGTGGIAATANLDASWAGRIPRNADFFISARSMFAPRYLDIGPPPNRALPDRFLVEGDEIRGIDPPSLDQILQRTWDSLNDTKRFMDAIRPASVALSLAIARLSLTIVELEPVPGAWASIDAESRAAYAETMLLLNELEEGDLDVARVTDLTARARALVTRVDGVVASMRGQVDVLSAAVARIGGALPPGLRSRLETSMADARVALAKVDEIVANVRGISQDISSRRGTIGAMLGDLELIDDMKELTKSLKRNPWRVMAKPVAP